MSSEARKAYSVPEDHICRRAENDELLEELKTLFVEEIKSNRTYDRIKSLSDLIRILEKRDVLNANNIRKIEAISNKYSSNYHWNECLSPLPPFIAVNNKNSRIQCNPELKAKVYETIASGIGRKWQEFGRNLRVPESTIDNLLSKENDNRIYYILNFHEENCDPKRWQTKLLNALIDCRRKDLYEKVQFFFDTYIHTSLND